MDDTSLGNTKGIHARITKIRKELIARFEDVLAAAVVAEHGDDDKPDQDRVTTAIAQHQMQVSTGALIKAAEDLQTLIRQLQEIWLFGQLNTLGDNSLQEQTDQDSATVAKMLAQLLADKSPDDSKTTAK